MLEKNKSRDRRAGGERERREEEGGGEEEEEEEGEENSERQKERGANQKTDCYPRQLSVGKGSKDYWVMVRRSS